MRARRTIAVITALLGLTLLTAGPASAIASYGSWRAYGNTNPISSSASLWQCGASKTIYTGVIAQVCAVRSAGGHGDGVQGAVIVRNNRSSAYSTNASVEMYDRFNVELIDVWDCSSSGVAANSWSVCFGETFLHLTVYAKGYARGQYLGNSGEV
jgi:hypothetical protein